MNDTKCSLDYVQLYKNPGLIDWKTPVVIDFETYYDKEWSLSKITSEKYIRCDKFECIGVSIKVGDKPAKFYRHETGLPIIAELVNRLPTSPFVSHNNSFDLGILAFRYGIHPNFMVDTAIMAKLCGFDRVAGGTSLAKLSDQLEKMGLVNKVKGTTVHNMLGVHAADMTEQQWQEYGDYCVLDSDLCYALYMYMIDKVPTQELIMADITTKMWTKPMIDLDVPLLQDYAVRLAEEREEMLGRIAGDLGFTDTDDLLKNLRSSKKFVALLESLQIEVPMKWSEKKQEMIPAVSKTDIAFLELLEHDNELVRTLVETKLGTMSSMEQTRTATFLDIASRGLMPIPLRYASAHTGRYGGMDKINCFSAGHEVLTPDGWVFVEDYQEGTPIMQWHADGTLSFDNNPAWLAKPYRGDMYEVDAPLIACKVTPEHRFSYVRHGRLECGLVTRTIEQVYNSSGMRAIPVKGYVNTPDDDIADDEIRYLVALQADGSVLDTKTCTRHSFGFRRVEKINRMEALLTSLGYQYSRLVSNKTTYFRVAPTGRGAVTNKNFGKWLLSLSVRQLTVFCDEILLWDGNKNSNNGSMEYNSTNRNNVLWVDTAMRLCGRHAGIYSYDYNKKVNPNHSACWRLYERTTTYGAMITERQIRKVQYDGMVYCPKVDSDMILVRYGTKIFVTNQCQNLSARGKEPVLRKSLRAVQNHIIMAIDASQVELRLSALVANQQDLIDLFMNGRDPYVDMAASIANKSYDELFEISKTNPTSEGKMLRQLGKACCLGLGYGASAAKFGNLLELQGLSEHKEKAPDLVQAYRNKNNMLVHAWKICGQVLDVMYAGGSMWFGGANNDLFFADGSSEFHGKKVPSIRLPNGTYIFYQNLRKEAGDDGRVNYVYDQFKGRNWLSKRIFSSALFENLIQALSFCVLKWQAIEMAKQGVPINLNVHDEWVSVVPRDQAPQTAVIMYKAMKSVPDYIPQGLLDCEVDVGWNYGTLHTIPSKEIEKCI